MTQLSTIDALLAAFPDANPSVFREETRVVVSAGRLYDVMQFLKERRAFDILIDLTCVDYLHYPEQKPDRFGLVYLVANTETNERITVRCFVGESDPTVMSLVSLWEGANWLEREVWDLFGIRFMDHPDLRRIVLPDEFTAHPLRKDYPLQGRGERHNFPVVTRADN